ncbi:MAG: NAD(P)H-hydrate epimerase [Alphaproteobacteria bacterium GM7ARS4]|nr:NAD(P)H-hydrate epimerase [Alphaproteobacteria bacterium GM7ARS4]
MQDSCAARLHALHSPDTDMLLTQAQSRDADAYAIAHHAPSLTLMENAARHVCRHAQKMLAHSTKTHVTVLVGPGNNGGDGLACARLLRQQGVNARCALLTEHFAGDAATMAKRWDGQSLSLTALLQEQDSFQRHLFIDGLFGIGLTRPLCSIPALTIERLNQCQSLVLAIDMPSGLHSDTGRVVSDNTHQGNAPYATRTITFFSLKPAHLLYPAKAHCGAVYVANLLDEATSQHHHACLRHATRHGPSLRMNTPRQWRHVIERQTRYDDHKYRRGVVSVYGDYGRFPLTSIGASRLTACSAALCDVGMVRLASDTPETCHKQLFTQSPTMWASWLDDAHGTSYVLGPGLITKQSAMRRPFGALFRLLRTTIHRLNAKSQRTPYPPTLILDAGMLHPPLMAWLSRQERHFTLILTPHIGEALRCWHHLQQRQQSKWQWAQKIASLMRATLILKGTDSVVAHHDGRIIINAHTSSALATAGSGDILSGILAGLCASNPVHDPFLKSAAAIYCHADAAIEALRHSAHPVNPSHILSFLPIALARWQHMRYI